MSLRKVFLWSMVAALGLDALLGIVALLFPSYGPEEEMLVSAAIFAAASLVALLCAIVIEKRRLVALMWTGTGCAAAACAVWLFLIWFSDLTPWHVEQHIARAAGTFSVAAIIIPQCGLLSLITLRDRWTRGVRGATVGVSAALGCAVALALWAWDLLELFIDEEIMGRGIGVLAILALCGTVMTPILWKVQSVRQGPAESIPGRLRIELTCPRCRRRQALDTGRGACAGCGLRIEISVEEPRCACGYLLHALKGDRCPECGRVIPASDRW
jgi:hypothetical protein